MYWPIERFSIDKAILSSFRYGIKSLAIECITGGQTAFANCLIAFVLETGKIKSSSKPINRFISINDKCLLSFEYTGIIAPPPLTLTAKVGKGLSKDKARMPLDLI